jgi:rsbT co-antagonist protein RsbR
MSEPSKLEVLGQRVQELERELTEKERMIELLFEHNPHGVVISDSHGNVRSNQAAQAMTRTNAALQEHAEWSTQLGFFEPDRVTPMPQERLGLMRALHGEIVVEDVLFAVTPGRPEGVFLSTDARPLPNGGALVITRDITERRALSEQVERRNAELAEREQDNRELIARLRVAVEELSTPVLEVWDDVLALPVVGVVDTQRSAQMTERLLAELVRSRAKQVIVDLTGVDVIDTSTADRFLKLARAVKLLGARCLVTGIQPAVAQTLVELGVDFGLLETHRNLKNALKTCIVRQP